MDRVNPLQSRPLLPQSVPPQPASLQPERFLKNIHMADISAHSMRALNSMKSSPHAETRTAADRALKALEKNLFTLSDAHIAGSEVGKYRPELENEDPRGRALNLHVKPNADLPAQLDIVGIEIPGESGESPLFEMLTEKEHAACAAGSGQPPLPHSASEAYRATAQRTNLNQAVHQLQNPALSPAPPPFSRAATRPDASAGPSRQTAGASESRRIDRPTAAAEFDKALLASTTFSLLPGLRRKKLPDELTAEQKAHVKNLLKTYDPTLIKHAVFDADGSPIHLKIDLSSVRNSTRFTAEALSDEQKESISSIFNDYSSHSKWLDENLLVRTVKAEDVPRHESILNGQEGVFSKRTIKADTFVAAFGGMLLTDPQDIENDKALRKMAGCDNYFNRGVSRNSHVLEGMGASMKFNAATDSDQMAEFLRNNLDVCRISATHPESGDPLKIMLFKANREISEGEQLCFMYDPNSTR